MSWIHDNEIKSYIIDLEKNQITFFTSFEGNDIVENTKIIFENVSSNELKNIGSGCNNIINNIEVNTIDDFFNDYNYLIKERKNYGWPINYKDEKELKEKLEYRKQKYYYIDAICGMYGFILASKCIIEVNNEIKEVL